MVKKKQNVLLHYLMDPNIYRQDSELWLVWWSMVTYDKSWLFMEVMTVQ